MRLFDGVWEVREDEFVARLEAREDDTLQHLDDKMVEVTLVVLASADLFINLTANLCVPLCLLLDEAEDIEINEALGLLESINNSKALLEGVGQTTSTN